MRPKILVTNSDRNGKVYDPPRWFAQVGKSKKVFTQGAWEAGGAQWINDSMEAS